MILSILLLVGAVLIVLAVLIVPLAVGQLRVYLTANLSSLLPLAAAFLVLVVAMQTMFVSHRGCSAVGPVSLQQTNPLLCPNTAIMKRMLDGTVATLPVGKSGRPLSTAADKAERTNHAGARAALKKDWDDAKAELDEAKQKHDSAETQLKTAGKPPEQPAAPVRRSPDMRHRRQAQPAPRPANPATEAAATKARGDAEIKLAEADTKLSEARNKSVLAEQKLKDFDRAVETAATAALLREGQARLLWFGSFGLALAVALGTIFAMAWLWAVALGDHFYPGDLELAGRRGKIFGKLLLVGLFSAVVLATICGIVYLILDAAIFPAFELPRPSTLKDLLTLLKNWLTYDDSLQSYLFGSAKPVTAGTLLEGGLSLLQRLEGAVIVAGVTIAAAVTAILYQHPEQVLPRPAGEPPPSNPYIQFLARCFQRLSVAIYFGAVLLVVSVACISAQYSWPGSLLDAEATEEPIKTHLIAALKGLSDQFAFEYGMIFTLLLFALFLPAWVVLRRRAWKVARTRTGRSGEEKTRDADQKWLESQGLGFTSVQHVAQVVALLAPAGAGTFVAILKAFGGG